MERIFTRLAALAAGLLTPAVLAASAMASTCPAPAGHPAPCHHHQTRLWSSSIHRAR